MSEYNREGRKRLSIDIPHSLYMDIRMLSGHKNCTVTKWVIRALMDKVKKEEGYGGRDE